MTIQPQNHRSVQKPLICIYTIPDFPKLPLLWYRTQLRRKPPPPTPDPPLLPTTSAVSDATIPSNKVSKTLVLPVPVALFRKHHLPPRPAPPRAPPEGGVGPDGQCGHLLGPQRPIQPAEGQREVELTRLELLVGRNGGDDPVELHLVGVADETSCVVALQHMGDPHGVQKLLEAAVLEDQLCGGPVRRGVAGETNAHQNEPRPLLVSSKIGSLQWGILGSVH